MRTRALVAWAVAMALSTATAFAVPAALWRIRESRGLPRPSSQRAEVEVAGNVSRLVPPLDVARVRDIAPDALSCGDFVRATAGFAWFCSRHYAVKTDLDDGGAAGILELLELAWPQYAALFGAVPPPERRLSLVVASDRRALKRAMMDDSMFALSLGGVTQEGYGCSYLYAGTPYQTRYIVLHEATHLFQYALSGDTRGCYGFLVEGVADFLSSHIYDPAAHTLAVNVLDRAPIHNHLADGLAEWRVRGRPSFTALYGEEAPSRGISVLLTAFLQSTPDFAGKWRDYCRRIVWQDATDAARHAPPGGQSQIAAATSGGGAASMAASKAASDALLDELYGGAGALDAPFGAWMEGLKPSYTLVQREFDQKGAAFVSCVPASPETPAVLEWRRGGDGAVPGVTGFSVRWRETPEKGSFAKVEFLSGAGAVTCVVSNSPNGSLAFFEVDGRRLPGAGARKLYSWLGKGLEIQLGNGRAALVAGGETLASGPCAIDGADGWRITASQPGIAFEPRGEGRPEIAPRQADAGRPEVAPCQVSRAFAIRDWLVLGPFSLPGGKFGHCRRPAMQTPVDTEAIHALDDGTLATWRPASLNRNAAFSPAPIANLTATFGRQANNSFAYALCHVDCDEAREATLCLGVSDGVEVFVNGETVFDDVRWREWRDGNVRVPVRLKAGRNEILLRLSHAQGVWLLSGGY